MQDWAPRLTEMWETEGQGMEGGGKAAGAQGLRAQGLHGDIFVAGSRDGCDGCWCPPSMRQRGRDSKLGQEQRRGRTEGGWDHRARGWELQPESWKRNKGQECWSMMGLGGGCHPVPPSPLSPCAGPAGWS